MPKFLEVTDKSAARTAIGADHTVATIAALKARPSAATASVTVLGYYAAGDGGGGVFRWDSTDTSSVDNGGTIITPTSGLSTSGRWKRVYEGDVNARWFGVHPSQTDNTAALQAAVNVVSASNLGGTLYIPAGDYTFRFGAGTSGLSTISIDAWNVTIRGDGPATRLKVTNNAAPNQVESFFTFNYNNGDFASGGGVHDLTFDGNSMLEWCISLASWQNFKVERIFAADIHGGVLDAINYSSTYYPNQVTVRDVHHGQPGGAHSQYLLRFRLGGSTAKAWTDCYIYNCGGNGVWDTGVVLDGCQRFHVRDIYMANSATNFTNNIDGVSRSGIKHCVAIKHTQGDQVAGAHMIDGIYLEETSGTSLPGTNVAVLIEHPGAAREQQIQRNVICNVITSALCGMLKIVDPVGRVVDTTFVGNRINTTDNLDKFTISSSAVDTTVHLYPNTVIINAPGATPKVPVEYEEVSYTGIAAAITSLSSGLTYKPANGRRLRLRFKDNGTARAITAGASFRGVGVTLPTTTTISKTLYWDCVYNATDSIWDVVDVGELDDPKVTANNTLTLVNKTLTSPKVNELKDTNGATAVKLTATASAVNYVQIANAASGGSPLIAVNSDSVANVPMFFQVKGDAPYYFLNGAGSAIAAISSPSNVSQDNFLTIQSSTGSNPVTVTAAGTGAALNLATGGALTHNSNPVGVKVAVPASTTSTGSPGQWAIDATNSKYYVCTATNTWKRFPITFDSEPWT